jgi:hypothetical protein
MKKIILVLVCLTFIVESYSQEKEGGVMISSLSFLDSQFHLNLEKAGQTILVLYEDNYYVYNNYNNDTNLNLVKVKIFYKLKKTDNEKYSFSLKCSSEFNGSFYYKGGQINKLRYVKSTE